MPTSSASIVRWIRLLLVLPSLAGPTVTAAATPALSAETSQALVEAVEAAAALDFYNSHCRSDDSGRHTDNLNKQLVSKLRLTITTVQDELFPERNFRATQRRLQEQNAAALRQAGGCKSAKEAGLPERLNARYRQSVSTIETLP